MSKMITVAAIQMEIVPHSVEENLNKAKQLIGAACKEQRIDLAVLPEDCLTGPLPGHLNFAVEESSKVIKMICGIASQFRIYLVAGSLIIKERGAYYNTSLLIDPSGQIVLKYKKNHLWYPEKRYLKPGTEALVAKAPIGNIGIAICWDLAFPDLFQRMALAGADVICIPSYWTSEDAVSLWKDDSEVATKSEATIIDTLCPARAIENECLVIYANGAGKAEIPLKTVTLLLNQVGHSQICAPILGTVARLDGNEEGVVVYQYDRTIRNKAERAYRLRQDKAIKPN